MGEEGGREDRFESLREEPVSLPLDTIICGHAPAVLQTFPDESVHCVISSPPYWGLRDFQLPPQVWGGDPGCVHMWGREERGKSFAWLGSFGLEPTPDLYVQHAVEIFRE